MPCAECADPLNVYFTTKALGINIERHSALYRCPACGTLYEVFPEERVRPREVSQDEARALFPGVL